MKGIRIGQLCFLAVLVTSAVACASASASLPEVGRCVKVATGKGIYKDAACTVVETKGRGKYEWTPVSVSERQTFSASGAPVKLVTAGHSPIECSFTNITGEYTGPKTATVQIEFNICTNSLHHGCKSGAAEVEIRSLPLEAEVGFIENQVKEGKRIIVVGLDLRPQPPSSDLMIYECEGITESARVEGSVIGHIGPIDTMTTKSNLKYQATGGHQLVERFEGGLKDTLITTFMSGLESTSAASTLTIQNETGQNAAPLEIKAR